MNPFFWFFALLVALNVLFIAGCWAWTKAHMWRRRRRLARQQAALARLLATEEDAVAHLLADVTTRRAA